MTPGAHFKTRLLKRHSFTVGGISSPASIRVEWFSCTLVLLFSVQCQEPDVPPPRQRSALSLAPMPEPGRQINRTVEPRFVPFEKLAEGLPRYPPPAPVLAPVTNDPGMPLFHPEIEPNNTPQEATSVSLPCEIFGHFHPLPDSRDGDHDWYVFSVDRDRTALLQVEASGVKGVDLALELHHEGLKGRAQVLFLNNAPVGKGEMIPNFRLSNGLWWLHVLQTGKEPQWNVLQPYHISLSVAEPAPDQETEPNDFHLHAMPLHLPARVTGLVNRSQDIDWFIVDLLKVSPFSRLSISLLPPMDTTLRLGISTSSRQEFLSLTAAEGRRVHLPNLAVIEDSSAYFIQVSVGEGEPPTAPYTLEVAAEPLSERIELEPNDNPLNAVRLPWETPMAGWIFVDGDEDWFTLEPIVELKNTEPGEGPTAMHLALSSVPGADLVLDVYDTDGHTLLARLDYGGKGEGEDAPNLATPSSRLYLKVSASRGYNSEAPYALEAQIILTRGMEIEPNNSLQDATLLLPGPEPLIGYLVPVGDRDCFRLDRSLGHLKVMPPRKGAIRVSAYGKSAELIFQDRAHRDHPVLPPVAATRVLCLEADPRHEKPPQGAYAVILQPE